MIVNATSFAGAADVVAPRRCVWTSNCASEQLLGRVVMALPSPSGGVDEYQSTLTTDGRLSGAIPAAGVRQ
jgi:hypothetical protein